MGLISLERLEGIPVIKIKTVSWNARVRKNKTKKNGEIGKRVFPKKVKKWSKM